MSKKIKLYPYGFIFSEKIIESVPEQYSSMRILDRYNYHFDDIYSPGVYESNNSFIIIHGHFVHIGFEESINNKDLPTYLLEKYTHDYEEFLDTLDFIAGRFVIIIGINNSIKIFPDAANARSTYYTTDNLIIASHPKLIKDNFNYTNDPIHEQVPLFSVTLDYSPYQNIRRALPNYYVDMDTHKSTRFYPRSKNKYKDLTTEQRLAMIEFLWKSQIQYYIDHYDNIVLSLSGGNDSRLSLAMAREHNQKLKVFTYTTKENDKGENGKFSEIMSLDQYVVKQILKDIPLNHRFFYMQNKSEKLSEEDLRTLNKNTIKQHGRAILPYYLNAFPEEKVLHIRTSVLEITTAYYYKSDKKNAVSSAKNTMKNGFKNFFDLVGEDVIDQKLDEALLRLKYGQNFFDYHILDLYFWENRIGAWHTEVLNETDSAFDTLLPFNFRAIIEIASSFPLEVRRSEQIFKELINRNHSVLNFYGVNDKSNLYEQLRNQSVIKNKSNNKIFNKFLTVNTKEDENYELETTDNTIYIPSHLLEKDNFSQKSFHFTLDQGILSLEIDSKYLSTKGKGYLQYEIHKNEQLLLKEDVADWNLTNKINILNMRKNDLVTVKVTALKSSKNESWEKASRITIKDYKEVSSRKESDQMITCTSPFSLIENVILP